jgi:hypothetical protein
MSRNSVGLRDNIWNWVSRKILNYSSACRYTETVEKPWCNKERRHHRHKVWNCAEIRHEKVYISQSNSQSPADQGPLFACCWISREIVYRVEVNQVVWWPYRCMSQDLWWLYLGMNDSRAFKWRDRRRHIHFHVAMGTHSDHTMMITFWKDLISLLLCHADCQHERTRQSQPNINM